MSYPKDFFSKLKSTFDSALDNGHLKFNGDSVTNEIIKKDFNNLPVEFQLTVVKSLMHRPEKGSTNDDPFEKPEPELTVEQDVGEGSELRIVLNKFPVVHYHFMLVTKAFVSQNTPLNPEEIKVVAEILQNLKELDPEHKWFSFYNCGEESGASQPHKHIQFMRFPNKFTPFSERVAMKSDPFIPNVSQEPLQTGDLPFAHFIAKFPSNFAEVDSESLGMYFSSLLQRTLTVLREHESKTISYNFIMTTEYMMLVPRSVGKYKELGINSCGFVGLILCKNEELASVVRSEGPDNILKEVGFPSTAGEDSNEYHY